MATKFDSKAPKKTTSKTTMYDWGDGKGAIHSISKEQHAENARAKSTPAAPPPGTYDPSIDYEEGKATRGYDNLVSDIGEGGTQRGRLTDDYNIGLAGIKTQHDRTLSDLLTARTRGQQDYDLNITNLQRGFQNLATQQAGQQRKTGTALGGASQQAAEKRAANEKLQRQPIDDAYKRFTDDSALAEKRNEEDYGAQGTQAKSLSLGYDRGTADLTEQLRRAGIEQTAFEKANAAARQFQASQLGYTDIGTETPSKVAGTGGVQMTTLTAAPGLKGVKKTTSKRKPRVVTYGASVGGP